MSKEYYESCAFPKPKTKKKKLLENGYKNKQDRICEITGMPERKGTKYSEDLIGSLVSNMDFK